MGQRKELDLNVLFPGKCTSLYIYLFNKLAVGALCPQLLTLPSTMWPNSLILANYLCHFEPWNQVRAGGRGFCSCLKAEAPWSVWHSF